MRDMATIPAEGAHDQVILDNLNIAHSGPQRSASQRGKALLYRRFHRLFGRSRDVTPSISRRLPDGREARELRLTARGSLRALFRTLRADFNGDCSSRLFVRAEGGPRRSCPSPLPAEPLPRRRRSGARPAAVLGYDFSSPLELVSAVYDASRRTRSRASGKSGLLHAKFLAHGVEQVWRCFPRVKAPGDFSIRLWARRFSSAPSSAVRALRGHTQRSIHGNTSQHAKTYARWDINGSAVACVFSLFLT